MADDLRRILTEVSSLSDAQLRGKTLAVAPNVETVVSAVGTMLGAGAIEVYDTVSTLEAQLGPELGSEIFATLYEYRGCRAAAETAAAKKLADTARRLEALVRATNPDSEPDFGELGSIFGPYSLTVANIRRLRSAHPERIRVGESEFVFMPKLGYYLLDVNWEYECEKFGTSMFEAAKTYYVAGSSPAAHSFMATLRGCAFTVAVIPYLGHLRIQTVIGNKSSQVLSEFGITVSRREIANGSRRIEYDATGKIERVVTSQDDVITTTTYGKDGEITTITSHPMLVRTSDAAGVVTWTITDGDFSATIPDSAHEIKGNIHRFPSVAGNVETTYEFRGVGSAPNWKFDLIKKESKTTTVVDGVQRCNIQIHTYSK